MMRPSRSTTVFLALLAAAGGAAHAQERLVGALQNQDAIRGCSWSASSAEVGPGLMLLAEYDHSVIIMNIAGADVRLDLDASSEAGYPSRVGDRVTKVYTAPAAIRVEATYTATWVCPPNQEGCEVTRFDVTFVVERGDRIETVRGAGNVGC